MNGAAEESNLGGVETYDTPTGDLGVGGPSDDVGSGEGPLTPPGYRAPDEVDPSQGPIVDREGAALGDLGNPGADRPR